MQPDRVVPTFDEAEAGHLGLDLGREPASLQQFAFERGEEALAHGAWLGSTSFSPAYSKSQGLSFRNGRRRYPGGRGCLWGSFVPSPRIGC